LGEIGVFLHAIIKKAATGRADHLSLYWMGAHLNHKGLISALKKIDRPTRPQSPPPPLPEEVDAAWARMSQFMRGLK
jgi:hypothetical protein